jgi:hypothetical protein
MVGLIGAFDALGEAGIGRYAIVGGVGIALCVGNAHRVTVDIDTVVDETPRPLARKLPTRSPRPRSLLERTSRDQMPLPRAPIT